MVTPAQRRRLFRDLGTIEPEFANKLMPFLKGLHQYYFRVEAEGWENVPPSGTALFIGNHNGLLTFEVLMLFYEWFKRYGMTRRAFGLAHAVALDNPFFSWLIPRIGAIPADPEVGYEALTRGYSLLCYPGGEKEAFRAYNQRKRVEFYGRKGFIKLALKAKVPIVPIVSIGAQETYVILNRGEEIAEKLGLKDKYRLHGVPITYRGLFFMWCVVTGIFTFFPLLLAPAAFASIFVPMPAKMKFKVLPPIDPSKIYDNDISYEQNLQRIYDRVVGEMQKTLTEEYQKRKFPVIG